jgi:hypothetical protein
MFPNPNCDPLRTCQACPTWELPALAPEILASRIAFPQWGDVWDPRKKKMVHALHTKVFTVEEALSSLKAQMEVIPTHVYKMSVQWEALAKAKLNLKPFQLITEEDYQVRLVASCALVKFTMHVFNVCVHC